MAVAALRFQPPAESNCHIPTPGWKNALSALPGVLNAYRRLCVS